MEVSAAMRMKALRELVAMTREAFCDAVSMSYTRVANLENERARLSVEDLAALLRVFPEFDRYLIFGDILDVSALAQSKNEKCQEAAQMIRGGVIPSGYGLELVIKDGNNS